MQKLQEKLVESLNETGRLVTKKARKGRLRSGEMKRVLKEAIDAVASVLTVLKNKTLSTDVVLIKDRHDKLIEKLDKFNKVFVCSEEKAFKEAGIKKNTSNAIIINSRRIRKEILRTDNSIIYLDNLQKKITNLEENIEAILRLLNGYMKDLEQAKKTLPQKNWRNIYYLVAGVTIYTVNSSLVPEPVVADVSKLFGSIIASKGV